MMDICMPGVNRIQLYSKIKVLNPGIKVLFLTALDTSEELLSAFLEVNKCQIVRKYWQ
jgi:two-component system response regulator ChvI